MVDFQLDALEAQQARLAGAPARAAHAREQIQSALPLAGLLGDPPGDSTNAFARNPEKPAEQPRRSSG